MRPRTALTAAAYVLMACVVVKLTAQSAPQQPPQGPPAAAPQGAPPQAGAPPQGRGRGTFPAQQRPPGDPAQIAKGNQLYGLYCRACHGPDLRGGDQGGPNLLRSQIALNDTDGESIGPIVQNGKQTPGMTAVMPPIPIPADDVKAVAAYIRSVLAAARPQGAPPAGAAVELNIVVGDAKAGEAYFKTKCTSCHSATGDLQGLATRAGEPMALQNMWVAGGGFGGRGGRGGGPTPVTATVTLPSGEKFEGRLGRIDDFTVVVIAADGSSRSFRREGDVPKVDIKDPRESHRKLLPTYTDKDIHDVTAYLVTLK
jgi:cytochrome c oxidase cbb3-type subunit III